MSSEASPPPIDNNLLEEASEVLRSVVAHVDEDANSDGYSATCAELADRLDAARSSATNVKANELASRLCDWSADGEPPVQLMQEAAAFIRSLAALQPPLPIASEPPTAFKIDCSSPEIKAIRDEIAANPPQTADDPVTRELVEALETRLAEIGGCTDGHCLVVKREGMHTNGGCGCHRDGLKMQRVVNAYRQFYRGVLAKLKASPPSNKPPAVPLDEQGARELFAAEIERDGSRDGREGAEALRAGSAILGWKLRAAIRAIIQASKGPSA